MSMYDKEEQEYKMQVLQSMKVRLEKHGLQLPQYVHELYDLYLGTYQNQFEFWTDEDCKIQRLNAYPEEDFLVVDEQVLIDRFDYAIFKGVVKCYKDKPLS